MKEFICVLLLYVCYNCSGDEILFKNVLILNSKVKIQFADNDGYVTSKKQFKLRKDKNNNQFFYWKKIRIYTNTEKKAEFKGDLNSFFEHSNIYPIYPLKAYDMLSIAFLINPEGEILYKGLGKNLSDKEYNNCFFNAVKNVNGTFIPASNNGINVYSLFFYEIDYFDLNFKN